MDTIASPLNPRTAPPPFAAQPPPAPGPADLATRSRDYERMSAALDWLGRRWRERPSLDEAAAAAGLSPAHFQRIFTRWAGVSPRTFLAALAHAEARRSLDEGSSVLDATFDAGLSGPSRLHDLFVAHEGSTPGQARRRGEGLAIAWGVAPSPFGPAIVAATPRGLCGLGFVDAERDGPERDAGAGEAVGRNGAAFDDLHDRFPAATWSRDDALAADYAQQAFAAPGGAPVALHLMGPPFHVQVWKALLRIPAGRTASYGQVAAWAGRPGANRAAGAAIGANPVSYLIPCHRAIARDGRLTGYHWGLGRKVAMLGEEALRTRG